MSDWEPGKFYHGLYAYIYVDENSNYWYKMDEPAPWKPLIHITPRNWEYWPEVIDKNKIKKLKLDFITWKLTA